MKEEHLPPRAIVSQESPISEEFIAECVEKGDREPNPLLDTEIGDELDESISQVEVLGGAIVAYSPPEEETEDFVMLAVEYTGCRFPGRLIR